MSTTSDQAKKDSWSLDRDDREIISGLSLERELLAICHKYYLSHAKMERRYNETCNCENTSVEEDKIQYPRTGKRGVPQQFPRKLYEMLEMESRSFSVGWTASGRGFQITNVPLFSEVVLPKWFKVGANK
eukprot:CCRYP_016700-RA/>CCRYP_016700-RA protein AED:0.04 eAED:0.04 QI:31/1/1/1/0/0/2/500/129